MEIKFNQLHATKGKKVFSFTNPNTGYYGLVEFLFYKNLWNYSASLYYKSTFKTGVTKNNYVTLKAAKKYFELEIIKLCKEYKNEIK